MQVENIKQHFLNHQWIWGSLILTIWLIANVLVLTTTNVMEASATHRALPLWKPLCWELTSVSMLIPPIILLIKYAPTYLDSLPWQKKLVVHCALVVPFSIFHVTGMMLLRKLWYVVMHSHYEPLGGNWLFVFLYEFRKDTMSYITIVFMYYGYRMMVLRLRGEAKYISTGEQEQSDASPKQLLVKKLGKEFLIGINDIDWIEASGNYANLHVGNATYPMRITMSKLETLLPDKQFARIHRSYIVNLSKVKFIEALDSGDHKITLQNDEALNFSRRYRESFKDVFQPTI